jgi:hypothetical protein
VWLDRVDVVEVVEAAVVVVDGERWWCWSAADWWECLPAPGTAGLMERWQFKT